jgi:hypothetical protein
MRGQVEGRDGLALLVDDADPEFVTYPKRCNLHGVPVPMFEPSEGQSGAKSKP